MGEERKIGETKSMVFEVLEDIDVWCFAPEEKLKLIGIYLDSTAPKINYMSMFEFIVARKVKFFPNGVTELGETFVKNIVREELKGNKYMLSYDEFLDCMRECDPDGAAEIEQKGLAGCNQWRSTIELKVERRA